MASAAGALGSVVVVVWPTVVVVCPAVVVVVAWAVLTPQND